MIIKKYKYLAKASNHNKTLLMASGRQSHLFCKLNMKYRRNSYLHQLLHMYSTHYFYIAALCVISLLLLPICCVDAVGYSYTRFIGPVAGPEHRIYVNDAGNAQRGVATRSSDASHLDYVAKPEYEFAYGVEDAEAHILHNRNEMRDGDAVKGVYSLIDPDGTLRVVKYTADDADGFQAEVITNGVSSLHGGQQQHDDTPYKTHNNNNKNNHQHQYHYQPQLKEGVYQPSNPIYTPYLGQPHINHYNPQNQYQTPPPSIIYHYNNDNYDNNNNDDADDDVDSGSDYNDDYQPQYKVHEKQNNEDHNENAENGNDNDGEGNEKKTNHDDVDDDDDDDSDSEDDYDDSDELEDHDEAAHRNEASEESDEYY